MANQQQQSQAAGQAGKNGMFGGENQTNGSPGNATTQHESSKMSSNSKGELIAHSMGVLTIRRGVPFQFKARMHSMKQIRLNIPPHSFLLNCQAIISGQRIPNQTRLSLSAPIVYQFHYQTSSINSELIPLPLSFEHLTH